MAPIVSVLALYALVRSFETIGVPFFMGIGKPKVNTIALFLQCMMMALFLPILLIKLSTIGAAWAMLVSGTVSGSVYIIAMYREKLFTLRGIFQLVATPLVAGVGMVYVLRGVEQVLLVSGVFELFFAIGVGSCAYFLLLWCCDRLVGGNVFQHLTWVYRRVFLAKKSL